MNFKLLLDYISSLQNGLKFPDVGTFPMAAMGKVRWCIPGILGNCGVANLENATGETQDLVGAWAS